MPRLTCLLSLCLLLAPACKTDDDPSSSGEGGGAAGLGGGDPSGVTLADGMDDDPSSPGLEPPLDPGEMAIDEDRAGGDGTGAAAEGGAAGSGDSATPPADPPGALQEPGCDLGRTRTAIGDRPVTEGELCDDVLVCADDADGAAALVAAVADFDCESGENVQQMCTEGQVPCVWRPSVLDADEAAKVCAATTVLDGDAELVCIVYL